MLVLSRMKNEQIRIGDDIVVQVVDIRGDKVRMGVQAPSNVPVDREEVYQSKKSNPNGKPDEVIRQAYDQKTHNRIDVKG